MQWADAGRVQAMWMSLDQAKKYEKRKLNYEFWLLLINEFIGS